MDQTKTITITHELANAILQYLSTRPYAEVYKIIEALMVAAQAKPDNAA